MTLYRSWMFVPGNQQRRLEKAKELAADVIVYDLEDAVPLAEKEKARAMVKQTLQTNRGKRQFVRVNDPSTRHHEADVCGLVGADLAGIMLPKAADREQLLHVDDLLARAERQCGLPVRSTEIVPLIETALGLYRAYEIAAACGRVKRLAFGSVDFTLDIGARLTKEGTEILYARSQLVVLSRAAGIEPPIDAVFIDVKDGEGLKRDAVLARQLGFQGKLVIHPDQIGVVNEAFSPSAEEIAEAKKIAEAFDRALAAGSAAVQVDGNMIDYPVAERARRILEQAKALNLY
jgi:citrate lyase subunit beta/citryl-CoA lyase